MSRNQAMQGPISLARAGDLGLDPKSNRRSLMGSTPWEGRELGGYVGFAFDKVRFAFYQGRLGLLWGFD